MFIYFFAFFRCWMAICRHCITSGADSNAPSAPSLTPTSIGWPNTFCGLPENFFLGWKWSKYFTGSGMKMIKIFRWYICSEDHGIRIRDENDQNILMIFDIFAVKTTGSSRCRPSCRPPKCNAQSVSRSSTTKASEMYTWRCELRTHQTYFAEKE